MGLPLNWARVKSWLHFRSNISIAATSKTTEMKKKCPEVKVLSDYSVNPDPEYWKNFPFKNLPKAPTTCINVQALKEKIGKVDCKMTWAQKNRAKNCVNSLLEGGDSGQKINLPACFQKNTPSTVVHGEMVADTVASWIKSGFVAGPFDQPPLPNFRVNPLMAVDQGEKIRLVINMSSPKGNSFNDNVKLEGTEKVGMTSARNVSYTIVEAGKNAVMSKLDKKRRIQTGSSTSSRPTPSGFFRRR